MFTNEKQKKDLKSDGSKKDIGGNVNPPNATGIPADMKGRFENLSGFSFDDVRVHYNSGKPAQLQSLAYTQGNQVYVGPAQEKHLGHELGHVVQQKQGRVQPTMRLRGINANDNEGLEREADIISSNAINHNNNHVYPVQRQTESALNNSVQFKMYTVSKSIPLVQIEKIQSSDRAKDNKVVKPSGQKVLGVMLEALRVKYPPTGAPPTEALLAKYDPFRGDQFISEKEQLERSLKTGDNKFITDDLTVTAANVGNGKSGNRKGDMADSIKKLTKQDNWIGAHLIKDSWGGADNMMNVVAWRKAAEDKWAAEFENHIDSAFTLTPETSADIKVDATKEDEYISGHVRPYAASLAMLAQIDDRDDKKAWLEQEIERTRWSVNAAIETVPLAANAMYRIYESGIPSKEGGTDLTSAETGYDEASVIAEDTFTNIVTEKQAGISKKAEAEGKRKGNLDRQRAELALKFKNDPSGLALALGKLPSFVSVFDEANMLNAGGKGVETVGNFEREKRSVKRKDAIREEIENLSPETFYIDIENYTDEDIEKLQQLGYDVTVG